MKKFFSVMAIFMMICAVIVIPKDDVYAANNTIVANKNYEIDLGNETKTFTFVVPGSGYFYYTVTPVHYIVDGSEYTSSWHLPNTKMIVNYKLYESTSVHYGSPFRSGAYAFKKGTKVKISLTDTNRENSRAYYLLKVVTKTPKNFEKESNNSKTTATKLALNTTYTGVNHTDDKDWWVFSAPVTGRYRISCVEINENKGQTVKAYLGSRFISSVYMGSYEGWKNLYTGTIKKGQKIYVLLDDGSKDEFYKLKVKRLY